MPRAVPPPDWVLARRRLIGAHVRAAREAANFTQQEVAERIEMDRATYVRIEQGQSAPLIASLIRIVDATGVDLAELVQR